MNFYLFMTEEQLLQILQLSREAQIPEKEACYKIMGKYMKLSYYKNKFGIKVNEIGKADYTYRTERTYEVEDNYFSELTNENCYYAGFIAADGNVDQTKTRLTIGLSTKDKTFLEKFLQDLKADYNIYEGEKDGFVNNSITITSSNICYDLEYNFNIVPNKSLIYSPPNLKDSFLDCFIMGLIDGDGTIGFSKRKEGTQDSLYISIVGTYNTVNLVKSRFDEILKKKTSKLYQRNKDKNFYQYRISDKSARLIFTYFYTKYPNISKLDRKWSKEIFEYCNNWKKGSAPSRQKGVNVFDLQGKLIKKCATLKEADGLTHVTIGRISNLCNLDDSKHQSKGYMFSRDKEIMEPYQASPSTNFRFLDAEGKALDKGESNIEDEA